MATWRTLTKMTTLKILALGGMLAAMPALAETPRLVSLGALGAGMQDHHPLALRCLGLATNGDLLRGGGRPGTEAVAAEDSDELPARVYGFSFASEDDEELACAMRQAQAQPDA